MKFKIHFALIFFLIFSVVLHAQSQSYFETVGKDFSTFLNSGKNLVGSPFENSSNFLRDASLTLAGTAVLFFADNSVRDFALRNQSELNGNIFSADKFYGNIYSIGLSVSIYGYGLLARDSKIRKTGLQAMTAVFYAGLATTLIKSVLGRHRPYLNDGNKKFSPFSIDNDFLSLPSGHTTVAFALSTVMANAYNNFAWQTFWYSIAGLTAASRIYHDRHWVSDVFLGAVIGYSTAKVIIGEKENPSNVNLGITPNSLTLLVAF